MWFLRRTAEYTLSDHKRNKEMMKELYIPQTKVIEKYKRTGKSMLVR
jgi:hypothetical protein